MNYSRWLVNHTDPTDQVPLHPPRPAVVTGELYGGETVTIPVVVMARAPSLPAGAAWLCVQQRVDVERYWLAWVPVDSVRAT